MRATLSSRAGLVLSLFCLAAVGCGSAYYEERLAATVDQFRYFEKLNQNLSPTAWSGGGVQMRIPLQFRAIPAPPPASASEAEDSSEENGTGARAEEPAPEDPRQPDFLAGGVTLPGLAGAWRAQVSVGPEEMATAYLYVLSNYDLWLQEGQGELATSFHDEVVERLAHGFGVSIRPEHWRVLELPSGQGYVPEKQYRATTLDPKPMIDEVPVDVSVYLLRASDNQAVVLSVVPSEARSARELQQSILLALETTRLADKKPRSAQEQPTGGGRGASF